MQCDLGGDMPIKGLCEHCGWEFQAKGSFAGRTVDCKRCGRPMTIPEPSPEDTAGGQEEEELVDVRCPACGAEYQVEEDDLGRAADCEECGASFVLGEETEKEEPELPPEPEPLLFGEPERAAKRARDDGAEKPDRSRGSGRSRTRSSRTTRRSASPKPARSRLPLFIAGCLALLLIGGGGLAVAVIFLVWGMDNPVTEVIHIGEEARRKSAGTVIAEYVENPGAVASPPKGGADGGVPVRYYDGIDDLRAALLAQAGLDLEAVEIETSGERQVAVVPAKEPGWGEGLVLTLSTALVGEPEILSVAPPAAAHAPHPGIEKIKNRIQLLHAVWIHLTGGDEFAAAKILSQEGFSPREGTSIHNLCSMFREARDIFDRDASLRAEGLRLNDELENVIVLKGWVFKMLGNDSTYYLIGLGGIFGAKAVLRTTDTVFSTTGNFSMNVVRAGTDVLVDGSGVRTEVPLFEEAAWARFKYERIRQILIERGKLERDFDSRAFVAIRHEVQEYQSRFGAFVLDCWPGLASQGNLEVWNPEKVIPGPGVRLHALLAPDAGPLAALDVDGHLHLLDTKTLAWTRIDCTDIHGSSKAAKKDMGFADFYPSWWTLQEAGGVLAVVNPFEAMLLIDLQKNTPPVKVGFDDPWDTQWMGRAWLTDGGRYLWVRESGRFKLFSLEGGALKIIDLMTLRVKAAMPLGVLSGLPAVLSCDKQSQDVCIWKDGEFQSVAGVEQKDFLVFNAWRIGPSVYVRGGTSAVSDRTFRIDLLCEDRGAVAADWHLDPGALGVLVHRKGPLWVRFAEADLSRARSVLVPWTHWQQVALNESEFYSLDGAGNIFRHGPVQAGLLPGTHWPVSAGNPHEELEAFIGTRDWKKANVLLRGVSKAGWDFEVDEKSMKCHWPSKENWIVRVCTMQMGEGKDLYTNFLDEPWSFLGSVSRFEGKFNGVGILVPERFTGPWEDLALEKEAGAIRERLEAGRARREWQEVVDVAGEGKLDEALRLVSEWTSRHGVTPEARELVRDIRKKVEEHEREAREASRARFEEVMREAERQEKRGSDESLSRALGLLDEALRLAPGDADSNRVREMGARIEEELRKRGQEDNRKALLSRAARALERGDLDDAERFFQEVLRTFPGDPEAQAGLKRIRAGRNESAFREVMARARRAESLGEEGEAGALYRRALELRPNDPKARAGLERLEGARAYSEAIEAGRRAEQWKRWDEAEEAYRTALGLRPGDGAATAGLARVARARAGLTQDFEKAFEVPEGDSDQHGNPVVEWKGSRTDPESGWPYEIWLRIPRMQFVRVPAGAFTMGSPDSEDGHDSGEEPAHRVRIAKTLYVGKYEVTQSQWEILFPENPSHFKGWQLPVESVDWEDARAFLDALTKRVREGSSGLNLVFRLPSEAEWEYVCRAGSKTRYNTGNSEADLARAGWYDANAGRQTHPVGKKAPNAGGFYDMHGNVWEWCEDAWHGDYDGAPADGSPWIAPGRHKVVRGGSWYNSAPKARSAFRYYGVVNTRRGHVGFRAVLEFKN